MSRQLTGTGHLVRLILRRDRILLPVWILGILALVYASAAAVQGLYTTALQRAAYAETVGSSPAAIAMSGPPTALHSLGGITVFEINTVAVVGIALMAIFLVVRHTRNEEETGRAEVLRSTVLGRHAHTAAALIVVGGACLVVGAGVGALLVGFGLSAAGSFTYGMSLAALGLAFAAIAACVAQVTRHARSARGVAASILAVAFVLRAVGDVRGNWMSWLSPIGWMQAALPFEDNRWWPIALLAAVTAGTVLVAAVLTDHRDLGSGMLPIREGRATAAPALGSAFGLAARLQRGGIAGWALGMFLGGVSFGAFGREIQTMVETNPVMAEVFTEPGMSVVDSYLSTITLILAVIAAGFTVSSVLRLRSEETAGRAEVLLATGLSRTRWVAGGLAVTVSGTIVVVATAGLGVGVAYAVTTADASQVPRLLGAALAYVPAVFALGALAVLLVGWLPRFAVAAWAAFAAAFVLAWLGPLLAPPAWVLALTPFSHVPEVPAVAVNAGPLAVLAATAVAGVLLGFQGIRTRDIG